MSEQPNCQKLESNDSTMYESRIRWQTKLLPLMCAMVIGLTLFFFLATCFQLIWLHKRIWDSPKLQINDILPLDNGPQKNSDDQLRTSVFNSLVRLEASLLDRRYHQANVSLMSRLWIRYLGFVTGMILSLVGATFILGKLQWPVSEVGAKVENVKFHLKSASPGLFLAAFGVVLMLITIVTHHEIKVTDGAVYTNGMTLLSNEFSGTKGSTKPQPTLQDPNIQLKKVE
jgi:hypothetical protein